MNPAASEYYRRVDAIFDALLDLPASEHAAFVQQACSDDSALRDEVLQLLAAHRRTASPLDAIADKLPALLLSGDDAPIVPERIGPFRIVRPIGQGGMGVVLLGERVDGAFEQRVAIKVLHHLNPGLIRRFLEERRILASLEHPGIAHLIDGGFTADGLPYFAMEYVDGGIPIDRYCDTHDLSLDQRLTLFREVCAIVSHAHGQLVVHRDLKPSNILVAPDGRVKLLDFGIAKLMGAHDEHARPSLTNTGMRVLTPEVAAPEQVRGEAVSTATDVYSLGVLLYRLVSGAQPYELTGSSPMEMDRIVCQEVPPPPSSRARAAWRRRLRGDLDLIVMTALQKEPNRRYQSPAALALDVQRFQGGEAIQARPDSVRYRLGKLIVRHRLAVAAATLVAVAIGGAAARERILRQRAVAEAQRAAEVERFLVEVFDVADPFATDEVDGSSVRARDLLERGAARIDSSLAGQPLVQARLRTVLGRVFMNLGIVDRATSLLQSALEQRRAIGAPEREVAEGIHLLGTALAQQDQLEEAERLLRDAVDRRRRLVGDLDSGTTESLERLATVLEDRNQYASAESLYRDILAVRQAVHGDTSPAVAEALNNLGVVRFRQGAYADAEVLYRQALAIDQRGRDTRHPNAAATLMNLAQALQLGGKLSEAERYYRQSLDAKRAALGDTHPSVTISLNNLGAMLANQLGRAAEGEQLIRQAIALDRHIFGPRHSYVAEGLRNLGMIQRGRGHFAAADSALQEALRINRELYGNRHERVAAVVGQLALLRSLQRRTAEALRLQRESLAMHRDVLGNEHPNTRAVMANLSRMLTESGLPREGEPLAREALAGLDSSSGGHRMVYLVSARALGASLVAQGRPGDALPPLAAALAIGERDLGANDVRLAHARLTYGIALRALGRTTDAAPPIRLAQATLDGMRSGQPWLAAQADSALASLGGTGAR